MSPQETLLELQRIGARIEPDGPKLRCHAPWGSITPELRVAFPDHRDYLRHALGLPKVSPECRKSAESLEAHSAPLTSMPESTSDHGCRNAESFSYPTRVGTGMPAPARKHDPAGEELSDFRRVPTQAISGTGVKDAESGQGLSADFRHSSELSATEPGFAAACGRGLVAHAARLGVALSVADDRGLTATAPPGLSAEMWDGLLFGLEEHAAEVLALLAEDVRPPDRTPISWSSADCPGFAIDPTASIGWSDVRSSIEEARKLHP